MGKYNHRMDAMMRCDATIRLKYIFTLLMNFAEIISGRIIRQSKIRKKLINK